MRTYLAFVLLFISFSISFSQKISGIVTDRSTQDPLVGVNVILSNTNGTTTNLNGEFVLNLNQGEKTITFKYIGYETVIKDISGNQEFIVEMTPSSEQIGTVVISAGKFEQKIEEITVSMEVIKPSLIENKNTTNIQTAMEQVPGVNITDGQANIRGGSGWSYGAGSRVLVMVDDMPLISGDAGQVQWKLIATENINQVEVIKGASSVLYGSSALNGVINIRTSFPKQTEIERITSSDQDIFRALKTGYTKISTHYGFLDFPKRRELVWWGDTGYSWWGENKRTFIGMEFFHAQKIQNLEITIGGNWFDDMGYREGEITKRKRVNFSALYRDQNIKGLSYGINGNFLFQSSGSAIVWNGFDDAYRPLNGEITTTNGDTYNIDPFIQYNRGNNRHTLKTRYLKVNNNNETKGEDLGQDNGSEIYYQDYQWQKNLEYMGLRITSGVTNEYVIAISDLFQGPNEGNKRKNHSLYCQLDKKIGKINISAGARCEYFSVSSEKEFISENGDTLTHFAAPIKPVFRTGINYQAAKATFIRSSWGQGYRFPSMAELFISANQSGLEIYANPELKPESGWSAEIGIKQGVKFNRWMGYIDAAAFLMRYDDMMEFSFGSWGDAMTKPMAGFGFKSINVGKTEISGMEISINGQGKINDDLTINILTGYTYIHPISLTPKKVYGLIENGLVLGSDGELTDEITYTNSSSDPSVLKYRYEHIAKLDAEIIYKKLSFGGSLRYNSFMKNIDFIFTDTNLISKMIPGINESRGDDLNTNDIIETYDKGDFIVDLRAGYQLNTIFRFGIIANNLFNTEYITRPANMMPPRSFAIQCNMKI